MVNGATQRVARWANANGGARARVRTQTRVIMRISSISVYLALAGTLIIAAPSLEAHPQAGSARGASKRILEVREYGVSLEYPPGWSDRQYGSVHELWNVPPEKLATLAADASEITASANVVVIRGKDHAEALRRLREIAAESNVSSSFLTIGGWPALQRREQVPTPVRGEDDDPEHADSVKTLTMVTTAVAVGDLLVRVTGFVPFDPSGRIAAQLEAMSRHLRFRTAGDPTASSRELLELRGNPPAAPPVARPSASANSPSTGGGVKYEPAVATSAPSIVSHDEEGIVQNLQMRSESEIAVSTNGNNIVVAQQCNETSSNNAGASFLFSGQSPGTCTGGDSSVAFGQSADFYWATIGSMTSTCPGGSNCNNVQEISRSTDNGQTFSFVANALDCRVTTGCGFGGIPDQEHIAADRINASGSGQDQVYLVFRKGFGYGMTCSTDNGATWSTVTFHTGGSMDFPRIAVAPNGTVFVITNNGNNLNVDSYSSCSNGLVQNRNQVGIATIANLPCPVPGLDRCNNGNVLASPTIAVDDNNSNHVYVAYATNTAAGNEDVLVQDSIDGGATWRAAVRVNAPVAGRRFMPWICAVDGTGYVSWFDRRNATVGANDVTNYYGGSALLDGGGNLSSGAEFRIDGASDAQCASGWPVPPRAAADATNCSSQAQLAGVCCDFAADNNCVGKCLAGNCPPGDGGQRCDLRTVAQGGPAVPCPNNGDTCNLDGGVPKYGDYTGNACQFGRFYAVWPSATNQPGAVGTGGIIRSFFNVFSPQFGGMASASGSGSIQFSPGAGNGCGFRVPAAGDSVIPRWPQNVFLVGRNYPCPPVAGPANTLAYTAITWDFNPVTGAYGVFIPQDSLLWQFLPNLPESQLTINYSVTFTVGPKVFPAHQPTAQYRLFGSIGRGGTARFDAQATLIRNQGQPSQANLGQLTLDSGLINAPGPFDRSLSDPGFVVPALNPADTLTVTGFMRWRGNAAEVKAQAGNAVDAPDAVGACNLPEGVCEQLAEAECTHVGGAWDAAGVCVDCSNPAVANGTPCGDGNACTTGDVCSAGVCSGTCSCTPTLSVGKIVVAKPSITTSEPDYNATISGWGGNLSIKLIRGNLSALRSSSGITNVDVGGCLANNAFVSSVTDNSVPASGAAYYLLKTVPDCNVLGSGSFAAVPADATEKAGAGGNRDTDIAASPNACP